MSTITPDRNSLTGADAARHLPFYELLNQGLLMAAFSRLVKYGEKKMLWEFTDKLKEQRQNYLYMIQYALNGVEDVNREKMLTEIKASLADIYEQMRRKSDLQKPTLYAATAKAMKDVDFQQLEKFYFDKVADGSTDSVEKELTLEQLSEREGFYRDIFNYIWTCGKLNDQQVDFLNKVVSRSDAINCLIPAELDYILLGALMLGELAYHDERRVVALCNYITAERRDEFKMAAIAALTLCLTVNRKCVFGPKVSSYISTIFNSPDSKDALKSASLEFARTLDTKRVSEDMQSYFRESFSKIGDEVKKSIKDLEKVEDLAELDENPEWMEMLDRTGLSEKMRQLSEIQEEGGDVFLQPFKQLKGDSFFYEPANWFLPFSTNLSEVKKIDPEGKLAEMVQATPFLCDNDKYSFFFALRGVPEEQRKLMLSQLEAGNMGAAEEKAASLDLPADEQRRLLRRHIQNLYRFFNLFRRASEFNNPFASEINLMASPLLMGSLQGDSSTVETIDLIAEFFFHHKYFSQALEIFQQLETIVVPTVDIYQKIGYCLQRLGRLEDALTYYEQSELLDSRSEWTVKRIASLKQALGQDGEALVYYNRLLTSKPDDINLLNAAARCNLAIGNYEAAIQQWHKVNYLDTENNKAIRGLALAYLYQGNLEKARNFFDKISALLSLDESDYVNLGHLALIEGKGREAIEFYSKPVSDDASFSRVMGIIATDADLLTRNGVDAERQQLLIEALTWHFQKLSDN